MKVTLEKFVKINKDTYIFSHKFLFISNVYDLNKSSRNYLHDTHERLEKHFVNHYFSDSQLFASLIKIHTKYICGMFYTNNSTIKVKIKNEKKYFIIHIYVGDEKNIPLMNYTLSIVQWE